VTDREGPQPEGARLSHVDESGAARMVDVSHKRDTERSATAAGAIEMQRETLELIEANALAKGDVLGVARIAGYMGAKRTAELIPLCHPLPLSGIAIAIEADPSLPGYRVQATVRCTGRTGVEMEALTAVSTCLLTIYDMAKGVDRGMRIGYIEVLSKNGGTSGPWQRA
jgi:cyclic pyranopterin phosphate synthase